MIHNWPSTHIAHVFHSVCTHKHTHRRALAHVRTQSHRHQQDLHTFHTMTATTDTSKSQFLHLFSLTIFPSFSRTLSLDFFSLFFLSFFFCSRSFSPFKSHFFFSFSRCVAGNSNKMLKTNCANTYNSLINMI